MPTRPICGALAPPLVVEDDAGMASPSADDEEPDSTVAGEGESRRNPWIWISALLGVAAVGLLIWALTARSDSDSKDQQLASTQEQLDSTQAKLESTQKELDGAKQDVEELQQSSEDDSGGGSAVLTAGALVAVKALIDDLEEQLGATQDDLEGAEQDLAEANDRAEQADKDATAAKNKAAQASGETEKAQAEADQAKAEAEAVESRAAIAADCGRAYVAALGQLFEGDDVGDQADAVRKQLDGISDDCKAAFDAL
jgi:hypothetical protein